MTTLKKNLYQTLDIFVDCFLNSTFAEDELQREVAQRIAGLRHSRTEPDYLASSQFSKVIFGDEHPYGKVSTEASLGSITAADLKAFYTTHFIPNNSYCVVSGDITLQEAFELLETKLLSWKKGPEVQLADAAPEVPSLPKVVVVDKAGAVQSAVRVGCLGIAITNPDLRKLDVMNVYLGGYFRSQLFQKLRGEKSYTYGVSSRFDWRLFPGAFTVSTSVGSEFTAPAIDDIIEEIGKLSTTLIPEDRFNEVKNYMIGSFARDIQTSSQAGGLLSNVKLYGLPMNFYDGYISSIQQVTREDVKAMAEKYLDVSKLSIVISGDNKTVAPTLSKFGNVESVDADGKPLP
jgi:zinc protease